MIKPEAWNRAAGAWIRACELAKTYRALPGETPLTVAWWLFERGYDSLVIAKELDDEGRQR